MAARRSFMCRCSLACLSTTEWQRIVGAGVPPNRRRWLFKIEADASDRVDWDRWCQSRGQKVRQIAFGGLSLNLRDLAAKKIRDVFNGASPIKSAIQIKQVVFRPGLLATTMF